MNVKAKTKLESGVIGDARYVANLDANKCLLIFMTAPLEVRADRAASRKEYEGKGIDEIKELLEKREEDEVRMGKKLFGVDYRDRGLYHVVLDSGLLTPGLELEMVKILLRSGRG